MSSKTSRGITLGNLLLVAFIVLKLCGVIDWSWWWVLAPLWAPLAIVVVVVLAIMLVIAAIAVAVEIWNAVAIRRRA